MKLGVRIAWMGAAILVSMAAARGQAPAPDPFAPAGSPIGAEAPMDSRWKEMIQRFSSGDFSEREAAQKQLDAATWRDTEMLTRLAKMAEDPEAKARIEGKLQALAEEAAINPPPLTLQVKGKSLSDVATILGQQMKVRVEGWPNNRNGPLFTLDLVDKPFWEVVKELNKQAPISIQTYDYIRLQQSEPGLRNLIVTGGLAVMPMSITRSKTVNFQQGPNDQVGKEQLMLQYWAALDPRVQVLRYQQPTLTEVTDDAGNALVKKAEGRQPMGWSSDGGRSRLWQTSTSLQLPANLGKKITSAKGEMTVVVQLAETKMEVEDIEKQLKKPITIGGQSVVINQFEVRNSTIQFDIRRENTPVAAVVPAAPAEEPQGVRVTFIDVTTNNRIWSTMVMGGSSGGVGGARGGPVKIELSVPTKTKQVVLPFEMKDLLLP